MRPDTHSATGYVREVSILLILRLRLRLRLTLGPELSLAWTKINVKIEARLGPIEAGLRLRINIKIL